MHFVWPGCKFDIVFDHQSREVLTEKIFRCFYGTVKEGYANFTKFEMETILLQFNIKI